jgi:hypothetical protein
VREAASYALCATHQVPQNEASLVETKAAEFSERNARVALIEVYSIDPSFLRLYMVCGQTWRTTAIYEMQSRSEQ